MKKIRLSDTDLELFDIEISPSDYNFYQKHKDAFRTMWREQGTPFWTRFVITFRSFTVKHGVIKQMNIDSPKFQNLIDQAFIFIHEQFVDGNDKIAKNFIEDVARLAQHQDKLPALDSKSFAKDPFYARETRELFRQFFGKPDQRSSYLKVYILCPVFLRFGGSVCRCLIRWVDAPIQDDPKDDSYWIVPTMGDMDKSSGSFCDETTMCDNCMDDSGTRFFKEKINGDHRGPKFVEWWKKGDPRFNDPENPLFGPHNCPDEDWREHLTIERFRSFLQYAKLTYLPEKEQCNDCKTLRHQKEKVIHVCRRNKKKKKKSNKQEDLIKDLKEVRDKIDELESMDTITKEEKDRRVRDIIEKKPKVMEALQEHEEDDNLILLEKPLAKEKESAKPEPKNPPPGSNATVTEDFQYGLLKRGDKACPKNVVAGFKVIKIEDEKNGLYEVNISAASIRSEEEDSTHIERMKHLLYQREHNSFILTAAHMKEKIEGLPIRFEWWEGLGFCVAVFNYQEEEKDIVKKWTNFTLKVAGFKEKSIKKVMLSLVCYVAKRKKRICHGWNMEVDDVVACVLPEESLDIEDLSISIQRGFRFEDRLTEEERASLIIHQPNFCFGKVLMGLEEGEASAILTEKGGKDKLKKLFKAIAEYELYGNEFVSALMKAIRNQQKNGKAKADILWDKMVADPDRFEFFCLVEKDKESDLWKTGLKTVDIRYFMSNKNPVVRICPICKAIGPDCYCSATKTITAEAKLLIDASKLDRVKVLDQDIPKMSYKEINSMRMDGERPKSASASAPAKENEKKTKNSSKKNKEKERERKIELSSLPKRFQEVGVIADKTLVSIPSKQNTELMGKVPINMDDKEDRMAPIPGLMSSLNLILQNGGKEQKITVSVGAYMPEGKLHEVQEIKNQMKLQSVEELRMTEVEESKDDNKSTKEEKKNKKSGKGKQSGGKSGDSVENEMKQENKADLDSMLLKEIFGAEEAKLVSRQINTQLGKTNKKHDKHHCCAEVKILEDETVEKDKKSVKIKEIKETDRKSGGSKNGKNKKGESVNADGKTEKIFTDKSKPSNKTNNNNDIEKETIFKGETIVLSSKPMDEELTHKLSLLTAGMPNCSVVVVNNEMKSKLTKISFGDKMKMKEGDGPLFRFNKRQAAERNRTPESDGEKDVKTGTLKTCANCKKVEPSRKAFKKCQKCKEEGVENTRYYCSRECQLDDWKQKHKAEHKNNQLKLKNKSS